MPPLASKVLAADEQLILVNESLNAIRQQTVQMKKCLDSKGKLMDALKHASTFLSELRTSSLSPKQYYELYISIYDSLEYLANYLKDNHPRDHLSKLYELVQYAGNIIPRLYLMITVGTVYMTVLDAPIKEIMRDMMEMCRGVQHPIRGLFLRYYLSQRTKNLLPGNANPSTVSNGTLQDSVQFIITNFIEMNKLWVRLQHQGHSRERRKRMQERQELQILVGSNLVRLSQLEGVDKSYYKSYILPAILEQIIQCRDMIAQEYLLDVIIQVFPDEFHLFTLKQLLDSTVNLIPEVSLKKILITLLDRLTNFIDRENLDNDLQKLNVSNGDANGKEEKTIEYFQASAEQLSKSAEPSGNLQERLGGKEVKLEISAEDSQKEAKLAEVESNKPVQADTENLFDIFFAHFLNLSKVRPDLTIDDITALYYGLLKLSLSYFPENFENIDLIYAETLKSYKELKDTIESSIDVTEENLKNLLLIPLNFTSIVSSNGSSTDLKKRLNLKLLLQLKNYQPLLDAQALKVQISISNDILNTLLVNKFILENEEEIVKVLQVLDPIVNNKDTITTAQDLNVDNREGGQKSTDTEFPYETLVKQENLAKLLHLIYNKDPVKNSKLILVASSHLTNKSKFVKFLYSSLIFSYLKIIKRLNFKLNKVFQKKKLSQEQKQKLTELYSHEIKLCFQRVSKLTDELYEQGELELAVKLLLSTSEVSNQLSKNEFTNEFFIKIFSMYEELISSKQQYQIIMQVIATLISFYKTFRSGTDTDNENYDSLITKTVLYSAKLLKKPDQCRAVFSASHFWFQLQVLSATDPSFVPPASEEKIADDNKRVLECLQKSLRISDSCIESSVSVELFVEILNQCIYYYIHGNLVNANYINNLIELIKNNLSDVDTVPIDHFKRTLDYISRQKEIDERFSLIKF